MKAVLFLMRVVTTLSWLLSQLDVTAPDAQAPGVSF